MKRVTLLTLWLISASVFGGALVHHKPLPDNLEALGIKESTLSQKLHTGQRILSQENWNVWGISPIYGEDGKVHVFFSRWRGTHGHWLSHSEIAHAVADRPEGPYQVIGTVLTGRGENHWDADTIHNPTIHKVGDQYALFYIGNNLKKAAQYDGHHASTQRVGLALADNLYGPYKRVSDEPVLDISENKKDWDSYLTTNPALLVHPNGEFWLYYKAWDRHNDDLRKMGLAVAKQIQGPYIKHAKNPLVSFSHLNKQVEDAYVYHSQGHYHMVMRDMGVIHPHVGLSLSSPDGIHWSEPTLGYRTNLAYLNEKQVQRMERPQILMKNGQPEYLFLALMGGKYGSSTGFVLKVD